MTNSPRFCRHCGSALKAYANFCSGCGREVTPRDDPSQSTNILPVPPPPVIEPSLDEWTVPEPPPPPPPGSAAWAGRIDTPQPAPFPAPPEESSASPWGVAIHPPADAVVLTPSTVPPASEGARRRSGAVVAGLSATVVVAGAVAAFILFGPSHHKVAAVSPPSTSTSSTPSISFNSSSTTSGSVAASLELQQAQSLNTLLAQSSSNRGAIVAATSDIANCGDLSQDQATLSAAAESRQTLLNQLSQIDIAQLPNATSLATMLNAAWQASFQSDNSYAAWAGDLDETGCGGQASADPNWQAAQITDNQATEAKTSFVAAWNPIAATLGLPQYSANNI